MTTTLALADEIERKIAGMVSPRYVHSLLLGGPQWTMIIAALRRSASVPSEEEIARAIWDAGEAEPFCVPWSEWLSYVDSRPSLASSVARVRRMARAVRALLTTAETAPQPGGGDEIVVAMQAWAPLISSGYQVPAAGQMMIEAAAEIERLQAYNTTLLALNAKFDAANRDLQNQIASARKEALEDAAKEADRIADAFALIDCSAESDHWAALVEGREEGARECARSIRSLISEVTY